MKIRFGVVAVSVFLAGCSTSGFQSHSFQTSMAKYQFTPFGCSLMKRDVSAAKKKYTERYFAFAGRKGATVTGMRGCGYAFSTSQARANDSAMKHCKKWEVEYGTDGGTKTCRLMEI